MMNLKKQKNILLVEDEPFIALAETSQLKDYGYSVTHVLNGQKAIETVFNEKNDFDLILMDINLGLDIDGTEAAKIILKAYDIPVLFLSSHMERDIVDKTENISSYGYVVKNSDIAVLDASIKMAFRLHRSYLTEKNQKQELEKKDLELRFMEKRYRRLFESAKDGIIILNAESGMIVDVNPYLIDMLGYSKEEFVKKCIWDISAFKNIDYSKRLFRELQEKDYVRYDNLPLETHDGKHIFVEFVSNVYLVDSERVIQCNIRDITERNRYERTLTSNIAEKEALLKELQHRTKNSFNMITSLIGLRSNAADSPETKKALEELSYRVKSISDLYSILYETDSFREVNLWIYCNKVIESMVKLAGSNFINKSIEAITVSAKDAATIGMILVELLTNAMKYAFPDKKGTINIELKRSDKSVVLSIEDNGIGLPAGFDIKKSKTLGLELVKLMITQLNGTIQFTVDNGTKILIKLPL